jgi:hypothetical protein
MHGDLAAAWATNPLWVIVAPAVFAYWVFWLVSAAKGRPLKPWPRAVWIAALVVLFGFGIARNLPWFSAWAPN